MQNETKAGKCSELDALFSIRDQKDKIKSIQEDVDRQLHYIHATILAERDVVAAAATKAVLNVLEQQPQYIKNINELQRLRDYFETLRGQLWDLKRQEQEESDRLGLG